MSTATQTAKRCVNCNKDVTSDKRMKDSSGKYWCLKCGEADQAKRGQTGQPCGGCGNRFPAAKLTKYGKDRLCPGCYKAAAKGPGLKASFGGGEADRGRIVKMVAVMAVLGVASACHFVFHLY